MISALVVLLLCVLFLPFTSKLVERNIELFLLVMGVAAVLLSQNLTMDIIQEALLSPIYITLAVFFAGLIFQLMQPYMTSFVQHASNKLPFPLFIGLLVFLLGVISSVITAIIAAIILVSIVQILRLERNAEIRLIILSCYSIGVGAVLTPIGEPLSTITVQKLGGDFLYLFNLLGPYIMPLLIAFSVLASLVVQKPKRKRIHKQQQQSEGCSAIFWRSCKIYCFVVALTLLGKGFEPFIEHYILPLQANALFWVNSISALLDNATLAAAEISNVMDDETIRSILLGLLISGGMLIPGNIPNIIAASKLSISSKEWASFGIPIGLITMTITFFIVVWP